MRVRNCGGDVYAYMTSVLAMTPGMLNSFLAARRNNLSGRWKDSCVWGVGVFLSAEYKYTLMLSLPRICVPFFDVGMGQSFIYVLN